MSSEFNAGQAGPSTGQYSAVWVAYALQAAGVFGFVIGPLVALIISYARRDADGAGFIASHHRWLIRTFWWASLGYLACLAVIIAGVWPIVGDLVGEAIRGGGQVQEFRFDIAWESIFATIGAAMIGGLGLVVVWIWNLYRIVRGAFLLADRSAAP